MYVHASRCTQILGEIRQWFLGKPPSLTFSHCALGPRISSLFTHHITLSVSKSSRNRVKQKMLQKNTTRSVHGVLLAKDECWGKYKGGRCGEVWCYNTVLEWLWCVCENKHKNKNNHLGDWNSNPSAIKVKIIRIKHIIRLTAHAKMTA